MAKFVYFVGVLVCLAWRVRGGFLDVDQNSLMELWAEKPQKVCNLPVALGPCNGYFLRYYFDRSHGRCLTFIYGGCAGNENNFFTKQECETMCMEGHDAPENPLPPAVQCGIDGLYPHPNCSVFIQCSNGIPHIKECPAGLHFSRKTQRCESPCNAECDKPLACKCKWNTCVPQKICNLPVVPGPCNGYFEWYYYDRNHGICKPFRYRGCGGNENNFVFKHECEITCMERPEYPPPVNFIPCVMEWLFSHPNCSFFIQCSNGSPHVRECPAGRHFSSKAQRCELPCNAECDKTLACKCNWKTCEQQQVCNLTVVPGKCKGYFPRYYFDRSHGRCLAFTYGGCSGNENNFLTTEECETMCKVHHNSPKDQLPPAFQCGMKGLYQHPNCSLFIQCSNGIPHIKECPDNLHFSRKTQRCESPCNAECDKTLACKCKWKTCVPQKIRNLPWVPGPCNGYFQRYYFDRRHVGCLPFTYGGCGGNENNFLTKQECETMCKQQRPRAEEHCYLEKVLGPCRRPLQRYYYNKVRGYCELFIYGGCGGNRNNFLTEADCVKDCERNPASENEEFDMEQFPGDSENEPFLHADPETDQCELEKDAGPCLQYERRFYYNKNKGHCLPFVYGGCKGNKNNFKTKAECRRSCVKKLSTGCECGWPICHKTKGNGSHRQALIMEGSCFDSFLSLLYFTTQLLNQLTHPFECPMSRTRWQLPDARKLPQVRQVHRQQTDC